MPAGVWGVFWCASPQELLPNSGSHDCHAKSTTVRPHRNLGGDPCLQTERMFAFSTAWALGGLLEIPDRKKFDMHLRTSTLSMPPQDLQGHSSNLGVFDYMITTDGACTGFKYSHAQIRQILTGRLILQDAFE